MTTLAASSISCVTPRNEHRVNNASTGYGPITLLVSRAASIEAMDVINPDVLAEVDTLNPGSGDSDTI